jgi:hypothetical protein
MEPVVVSPLVVVVSRVTERVAVFEPTVSVQLTVTCCAAPPLVTVAVGLANAT